MNKEVFSKFTFGFLMAQLFPGIVAVSALSLAVKATRSGEAASDLWTFAGSAWEEMFAKPAWIPAYLFLAVGTGMLIHGLNWTVLAWLENHKNPDEPRPVRETFWHGRLVLFQLLLGPIKMVAEIAWLLVARGLKPLAMDENVPNVKPERMANFVFLQEFYLYFAQFYAHTAYALLFAMPCLTVTLFHAGWSWGSSFLLVVLYFATSLFFLVGRVQLNTLFKAERALSNQSETEGETHPSREKVHE